MRPSVESVLMQTAHAFSSRSTCSRLHVGAVLARDSRVIATGYNGAPAGMPHCRHQTAGEPCTTAVHAEANAVAFAARYGIATDGATLYVTDSPCLECAKLLVNAGVVRVVYAEQYRSTAGLELLTECGVDVVHVSRLISPSL